MDYKIILWTLMFVVLDVVSGTLQALINGTFESSVMRKGGLHKLTILFVIIFLAALDYSQEFLGINVPFLNGGCVYICYMEIMSTIENINKAFPNALPKTLTNMLKSGAKSAGVDTEDDTENVKE